jgi:hypothetical protein
MLYVNTANPTDRIAGIIANIIREAELDDGMSQRLTSQNREFETGVRGLVAKLALPPLKKGQKSREEEFGAEVRNLVAKLALPPHKKGQKRDTKCGYPHDFHIQGISVQVAIFQKYFPLLEHDEQILAKNIARLGKKPSYADGLLTVPRQDLIGDNYEEALDNMLHAYGAACGGVLTWRGYGKQRIRPTIEAMESMQILQDSQEGDILVFWGQLGILRAGWSVNYFDIAKRDIEVPLQAYTAAASLLANIKRLGPGAELGLICPGDRIETKDKSCSTLSPVLFRPAKPFKNGQVVLGTLANGFGLSEMGIASLFPSQ